MQLKGLPWVGTAWIAAVTCASVGLAEPASRSPVHWKGGVETSAYQDTDAVSVLTPALELESYNPLSGWSANGSYLVDIVSAASVDIVSSASPNWTEVRHAGTLALRYQPGEVGGALSGAVSSEPDYLSFSAGARAMLDLARKNATLAVGYTFTHDTAGRTGTPFSVYSLTLVRHGFSGALDLVLDRATLFTGSLDLVLESGRQEKPYRYLPLFDATVAPSVPPGAGADLVNSLRLGARASERLPDTRQRVALSGRLAHRFRDSTLLLFDRAYADSWGLLATTLDLRYVVDLGRRWSIWPHGRGHLQSGVSFWRRAYVGEIADDSLELPVFRTGDRELSPLFSATLGPGLRWDFGGDDPRAWSAILELEGTYTRYADALYVERRWAGFGSAQVQARFR